MKKKISLALNYPFFTWLIAFYLFVYVHSFCVAF